MISGLVYKYKELNGSLSSVNVTMIYLFVLKLALFVLKFLFTTTLCWEIVNAIIRLIILIQKSLIRICLISIKTCTPLHSVKGLGKEFGNN